jgi:hypothetical protein|tara:strand:+ start:321 stop:452 length:132 start_codon:yes stop_codon:yes gene_type:complete
LNFAIADYSNKAILWNVDMVMKDGVIFKHNGIVDEALLLNFGK